MGRTLKEQGPPWSCPSSQCKHKEAKKFPNFQQHLRTHIPKSRSNVVYCQICGSDFTVDGGLVRHNGLKHPDLQLSSSPQPPSPSSVDSLNSFVFPRSHDSSTGSSYTSISSLDPHFPASEASACSHAIQYEYANSSSNYISVPDSFAQTRQHHNEAGSSHHSVRRAPCGASTTLTSPIAPTSPGEGMWRQTGGIPSPTQPIPIPARKSHKSSTHYPEGTFDGLTDVNGVVYQCMNPRDEAIVRQSLGE